MTSTVRQLKREAKENASKKVKIFNPDDEDFTRKFEGKPYTIHAQEVGEFPFTIANHLKKHLKYHLMYKRKIEKKSTDLVSEEIEKEITVKL